MASGPEHWLRPQRTEGVRKEGGGREEWGMGKGEVGGGLGRGKEKPSRRKNTKLPGICHK